MIKRKKNLCLIPYHLSEKFLYTLSGQICKIEVVICKGDNKGERERERWGRKKNMTVPREKPNSGQDKEYRWTKNTGGLDHL